LPYVKDYHAAAVRRAETPDSFSIVTASWRHYTRGMRFLRRKTSGHGGKCSNPHHKHPPALAAFSLIEMLITMAILIILMTTYYGFGSRSHQRQQQKLCRDNLQKIFIALQIYANDFNGNFPVSTNAKTSEEVLNLLVPRYTSDTQPFICPGSKDSPLPAGEPLLMHKISYAYLMGRRASDTQELLMSDRLVDTLPKLAGQAVFSVNGKPPGNNHHKYGGNFLFCDGRTEFSPTHVSFSLVFLPDIVLLNPKP
jgi:prepilin-type N-terminal cleavage/methylation domain-containing protein/prepilin-type processing-associated H-X9-DG protein